MVDGRWSMVMSKDTCYQYIREKQARMQHITPYRLIKHVYSQQGIETTGCQQTARERGQRRSSIFMKWRIDVRIFIEPLHQGRTLMGWKM